MSILKKLAFKLFSYSEKKKLSFKTLFSKASENQEEGNSSNAKKANDLSQPSANNKRESNRTKQIIKKVLIWFFVIAVIGTAIGLIAYYATRPKSIQINNSTATAKLVGLKKVDSGSETVATTLVEPGTSKVVNISNGTVAAENANAGAVLSLYGLSDPNNYSYPSYTVNLIPQNIVKVYYNGTNYSVYLETATSNLPIVLTMNVTTQGSYISYSFLNIVLTYNFSSLDNTTNQSINNPLLTFFNSRVLNAATYPPSGFNWSGFIISIIPIIFLIIMIAFYARMMKKQGMGGDSLFSIGKANAKSTKTNVKFSDVAGIAEVKEELMEIVDYIQRPQKYAAMGARSPKGLILYGPPGTGKTLIAKAVAGEANCNFFPIAGSSFEDMLVGVGAKRVRDLFQKARKDAPSIIFIDEIDSVASKRGKNDIVGGSGGVADQTINQLLAEMDGFTTTSGVVVIAATNRLDVLDEAILRPGRFDRQIQVSLPDISERHDILKIHAKNKNLSKKVNLLDIARRTPGFSGAQLENVLNEATLLAVRQNKTTISMNNLDEAIDRTIGGPQRKTRVMSEQERKQISYHEAGHALVGLHTENTEVVQKITIIPRGNAAGYTLQTPQEQEKQVQTKTDLLNNVRMTLGGRASEEIVFGPTNISTGASNDLYKASNIVRAMVTQLGMSDLGLTQFVPSEGQPTYQKLFSEATGKQIDDTVDQIIAKEYELAKKVIINNRRELDLIVETLLVLETIVKEQIDYIHKNLQLPPEAIARKAELDKAEQESKEDNDSNNQGNNEN